jgi:hypothetical protein
MGVAAWVAAARSVDLLRPPSAMAASYHAGPPISQFARSRKAGDGDIAIVPSTFRSSNCRYHGAKILDRGRVSNQILHGRQEFSRNNTRGGDP